MDASDPIHTSLIDLAGRGPSTYGLLRSARNDDRPKIISHLNLFGAPIGDRIARIPGRIRQRPDAFGDDIEHERPAFLGP